MPIESHDLNAEHFEPLLTKDEIPHSAKVPPQIHRHCAELRMADGIVIVHPNWWGQPPVILKGWIDRVLRPGVAYCFDERDNGEGIPIGLLRAHGALVINTSNTPDTREKSVSGDPLERIWRECIFDLCGGRNFHRLWDERNRLEDWFGDCTIKKFLLFDVRFFEVPLESARLDCPLYELAHLVTGQNLSDLRGQLLGRTLLLARNDFVQIPRNWKRNGQCHEGGHEPPDGTEVFTGWATSSRGPSQAHLAHAS